MEKTIYEIILLNIFRHLKLEITLAIPASNDVHKLFRWPFWYTPFDGSVQKICEDDPKHKVHICEK